MQTIYKLYSATQTDAAASVDIQEDGVIEGVLFDLDVSGADALNDAIKAEVSFASTSGFTSNDTRASLAGTHFRQEFLTSGGGPNCGGPYVPMEIPVSAGERIYLHMVAAGTVVVACQVWIYVRGGNAGRRPNFRSTAR